MLELITSSTHSSVQAHRTREHAWFQPTAVHSASHRSPSLYVWAEREVSWRVSGVPALAAGYKCYTCPYLQGYQCFPGARLVFISSSSSQLSWTGPKWNIWPMASKPKDQFLTFGTERIHPTVTNNFYLKSLRISTSRWSHRSARV